jgi:acetylornithine deacetylase/succinyl-diaminopimelate desuccinylase-like protein
VEKLRTSLKVNLKRLTETLIDLVKIPSPPGKEAEIAKAVAGRLEELGLKPSIDEYFNVKAELGSKGKTIVLNAHLDHVPPSEGWSFNPYEGKLEGSRIYGVGASDNKSGVAAMLEIAEILSRVEEVLKGRVVFLFTSREETSLGKDEARSRALHGLKADGGLCLDTHLLSEDGKANLVVGCRGILNLTLMVLGRAYHSSEPEKGINSIYISMRYIQALRKLKLPKSKRKPPVRTNLSVTKIATNGWATRIPDKCTLTINYRALPEENLEKAKDRLLKLASKKCREGFKLESVEASRGYRLNLREPMVKASLAALKELGLKAKLTISRGWIDAASFKLKAGIPMVGLGTPTKGQAHVPNEWEDLECLKTGAQAALMATLKFLEN